MKGELLLAIWARWAKSAISLGYPRRSAGIQGASALVRRRTYNEDVALIVEDILLTLKEKDELAFKIVRMKYIFNIDFKGISAELCLSFAEIHQRISEAKYFVDGAFTYIFRERK